jgi:hypothetical protein
MVLIYPFARDEMHNKGEKRMTVKSEQFAATGGQMAQIADSELSARQMNVGSIERLVSILVGAIGLLMLSRRLFVYVTLAALSGYLLFRGITGRCALYARANIDTRGQEDFVATIRDAGVRAANDAHASAPADRIGEGDSEDSEIARWMESERAIDPVEQASWESFPASDPPGKA